MILEHGKVYTVKNRHTGEVREARYHYTIGSDIDYPYFYWPVDVDNENRKGSWVEGYDAEAIE